MKKITIKSLVIGTIVWTTLVSSTHAYTLSTWAPVQYLKQIILTTDGSNNLHKATIQFDGTNGTVSAKSVNADVLHMHGHTVATQDYANNKANSALSSAKSYAHSQANSVLNSAKSYANSKANSVLNSAKSYATSKANSVLNGAKSYANRKASSVLSSARSYAHSQANSVLQTAKSYAASKAEQVESTIRANIAWLNNQAYVSTCNATNLWKINSQGKICTKQKIPDSALCKYLVEHHAPIKVWQEGTSIQSIHQDQDDGEMRSWGYTCFVDTRNQSWYVREVRDSIKIVDGSNYTLNIPTYVYGSFTPNAWKNGGLGIQLYENWEKFHGKGVRSDNTPLKVDFQTLHLTYHWNAYYPLVDYYYFK